MTEMMQPIRMDKLLLDIPKFFGATFFPESQKQLQAGMWIVQWLRDFEKSLNKAG